MFERLSIPARQAIADAHGVARSAGRTTVSTGDLVAGFLSAEGAVAGDVLRCVSDVDAMVIAAHALPESNSEPGDLLRIVIAGAVGVAAARGTRQVGSTSVLLALVALEPASLVLLLRAIGGDAAEISGAARTADDSSEFTVLPSAGGCVAAEVGADPLVHWFDESD
jgi:hypothetical protein